MVIRDTRAPRQQPKVPRIPSSILDNLDAGPLRRAIAGELTEAPRRQRAELEVRYREIISNGVEFKATTTSTLDKNRPLLRWFFYKEGFASDLVEAILRRENSSSAIKVLDPFGGIGTVPYVCQQHGIEAVSVDISPLPVFIANTKMKAALIDSGDQLLLLSAEMARAIEFGNAKRNLPDVSIWIKAFDQDVGRGLFAALDVIQLGRQSGKYPHHICDLAHLALLTVAEEVSHTVKDGTSLRLRPPGRRLGRAGVEKSAQDLKAQFEKTVVEILSDIARVKAERTASGARYSENKSIVGDARQLLSIFAPGSFDLVITSPPYPNRYDYSSIYALELLLGFVQDREELRALRFDLFRSHLEAPWPTEIQGLTPPVEEVLASLLQRGMSSPRVFKMILGYFADLATTLGQIHSLLKANSSAYFVVGNVRVEGEEVPVDLILADMAERLGFEATEVLVARYKGTNSQQAKRFGAARLRESVVVLRKA